MEFRVLGALEVGPGGAAIELGPPKQRALLAILLLHVGEIVPVDRLIDLLWGDDPPRTAGHSVQIYISELRKALGAVAGRELIVRRAPGYQLDAPAEDVDASRFEALVREGSAELAAGKREAGTKKLQAALDLWRGPALSDFAYEEFAQPYIRRLNDLHLDAIEELAAIELEGGQAPRVVTLLEAAIREDPLRERSRELLMLALYRSGRHAEALRTYERLREQLVDELGLEPSPPLQQLRDRVLLHDPTLLVVAAPDGPGPGTERNPYKGLQAFGESDAHDFFGREALIDRLLGLLADGQRLVALVGPSGSGKSSLIAAGVIPRLRRGGVAGSDRWVIVNAPLGPDPLGDLQTLLSRAGRGSRKPRGSGDSRLTFPPLDEGGRVVLVMDQFEELFTLTEESRRDQFLAELARAVRDDEHEPIVLLGLRADYYDRPLQHGQFGEVFVPGVVHILPMSPHELQASIAEPAARVGVNIEQKLLAELVADSAARPGSLPLLQYALTELYEHRAGTTLAMTSYAALGGLRGVLTRRAEATFLGLSPAEQSVAIQVFLRLVRLGRGTADSRRRLVVSELTGLGIDSVELSAVLLAFSRHRLLTFDRDEVTGEATVELAHEALLTEWERLAGWIDRHRAALRRRDALLFAVDEWQLAGRDPEYLLAGTRLAEFETWREEGSLQLTRIELDFLDASAERRDSARTADELRQTQAARLAKSARNRLVGIGVAGAVAVGLAVVLIYGMLAARPTLAPVAYAWVTEGLVVRQALDGFDRAVTEFGLVSKKISQESIGARIENELGSGFWASSTEEEVRAKWAETQRAELRGLAESGTGLIMVDGMLAEDVAAFGREFPQTKFAVGAPGEGPSNVVFLTSIDSEPSYVAGAAAALRSGTGTIGFIGGVDWEVIWGFAAGYEAGARSINPDVAILVDYLSEPDDFSGFDDQAGANDAAAAMYEQGADVIFHAAGTSGLGLFDAAVDYTDRTGRQVWAIGVDTDQYISVFELPGATNQEAWQRHILTSVLKGIDTGTYDVIAAYARGEFVGGTWSSGVASSTSGISYSGGYIDDLRPTLEDIKAGIIAGTIKVPCIPVDRIEQAAAYGLTPESCPVATR